MPTTIGSIRVVGIVLSALMAVSCGTTTAPDTPWLRIEPTRAQYAPGDTVMVTVRNVGPTEVGFTTCRSELQRLEGSGWSDVAVSSNTVCGDVQATVSVGASRNAWTGNLPTTLDAGTYRYRIPSARELTPPQHPLPAEALLSSPFLVKR